MPARRKLGAKGEIIPKDIANLTAHLQQIWHEAKVMLPALLCGHQCE